MPDNLAIMARETVAIGPTGRRLAANVLALRKKRGLNQPQLARGMQGQGRSVHATVVSKIEQLDRRVDVDDLVALAVALGVTPNRLLLTEDVDGTIDLTPAIAVHTSDAWKWATGEEPLGWPPPGEPDPKAEAEARAAFVRENRPHAGDYNLDAGLLIGDDNYALYSVLATLMAAARRGMKPELLHQLVETAVAGVQSEGDR